MILVEREPTIDERNAIQDAMMLGDINPTARLNATLWVVVAESNKYVVVRIAKATWVILDKGKMNRIRWCDGALPLDKLNQIMI